MIIRASLQATLKSILQAQKMLVLIPYIPTETHFFFFIHILKAIRALDSTR